MDTVETTKVVLANADRLSAMANSVAGFAISSELLVIFRLFERNRIILGAIWEVF